VLFRLAEGVGLEPTSPFGQRFSSPLMAFPQNVANLPGSTVAAYARDDREEGDQELGSEDQGAR
jgi:hypothetical protein